VDRIAAVTMAAMSGESFSKASRSRRVG